jgi:hypothetical protein
MGCLDSPADPLHIMDAIERDLDPRPSAIYVPSRIPSASKVDGEMLKMLWQRLGSHGIPILPP